MTRSSAATLLALLAVAAWLRLVALGDHPLWLDEANSVLIAWQGWTGIPRALAEDGNPPLFYALLRAWIGVFGASEAAVRSLAASFGVAFVAAVFWAARELMPGRRHLPLLAAAIAATAPLHVAASRTARMYALTPLLALLAIVALVHALRRGSSGWLAVHALLLTAGLYTHNYFLFLLPIGPAVAALAPGAVGRRRALLASLSASAAVACAYLPWVPVLSEQLGSGVSAWIEPHWTATPPALAVVRSLEVMGVGGAFPGHLGPLGALREGFPSELLWITARVIGAALVALLLIAGIARGTSGTDREAIAALLALLALPLLLPWLASFLVRPVYLVGRYEMVAYGAFAILAARGVDALFERSSSLGCGVGALWVALSVLSLYAYFSVPARDSERRSAEWVIENAGSGDVIVFPGYARAVPEYYLRRNGFRGERFSFPQSVGRHMGWFDYGRAARDPVGTRRAAARLAAQLAARTATSSGGGAGARAPGRVIVIDVDPVARRVGVTGALRAALRAKFGREASIPSASASSPPPVHIYIGARR